MDIKALRQKVLDLGIRGKLVPQNPDDEPASVLLEKIRQEKEQMIKEGKLKKKDIKDDTIIFKGEDGLYYEQFKDGKVKCINDEIPFEVPEGWEWCRLNTSNIIVMGSSPAGNTLNSDKIGTEFHQGKINFSDKYILESEIYTTKPQKVVSEDTILLCVRAPVGEVNITSRYICIGRGLAGIILNKNINQDFLYYYLKTIKRDLNNKATGSTFVAITAEVVKNILIPLPSLNEQQHIVEKLEEILKQIDSLEQEKEEIQFLTKLSKNKLLDLAIRGQLVPQSVNDEPASVLLKKIREEKEQLVKESKLKPKDIKDDTMIFKGEDGLYYEQFKDGRVKCIDDEISFEVPEGWEWYRLGSLTVKEIKRGKAAKYSEKGSILVLAQKCNQKLGGINLELAKYLDETTLNKYSEEEFLLNGDTIINSTGTGTIGRVGIINRLEKVKIVPDSHVTIVRAYKYILNKYVYFFLKTKQDYLEKSGEGSTNQKELKPKTIKEILFPLPPLNEQQRIVEKLEQLFTQIDRIEAELQ